MLVSPKRFGSEGSALELVTWADGTDEQIVAMVEAADNGDIELTDYWAVGDERTVSLAAMAATSGTVIVSETHTAQDVTLVIMNEGYSVNGVDNSHVHFVVGLKNCLNETGYMNSTGTNAGGWKNCARRGWCNSIFYASFPDTLKPIFKLFNTKTANGGYTNYSAINTAEDRFALFAGKEIFNTEQNGAASNGFPAYSGGYSMKTEADNLSQITWYATAANRLKQVSGSNAFWWERSPIYSYEYSFCSVNYNGGANFIGNTNSANDSRGLAPFGCI